MMRVPALATALVVAALTGAATPVFADPWKDESGQDRRRGGHERSYGSPDHYGYGYAPPRRERRAFKQEYDDGNCKYERKLEKSGEYKEEVKCRGGRKSSYSYRY